MGKTVAVEARKTWVLIVSNRVHASRMDAVTNARRRNKTLVTLSFSRINKFLIEGLIL